MSLFLLLIIPVVGLWIMVVVSGNRQSDAVQLMEGIVETLMVDIGLVMLILLIASLSNSMAGFLIFGIIGIGVLQLIYVIPRSLFLRRQQRWARFKGVIIGAVIMALLNGGCWLMLSNPW